MYRTEALRTCVASPEDQKHMLCAAADAAADGAPELCWPTGPAGGEASGIRARLSAVTAGAKVQRRSTNSCQQGLQFGMNGGGLAL
jgi:hypothetical protein